MTATFTITLEVDDISEDRLNAIALDIHDAVQDDGMTVTQVSPWARPTLPQLGGVQQPL